MWKSGAWENDQVFGRTNLPGHFGERWDPPSSTARQENEGFVLGSRSLLFLSVSYHSSPILRNKILTASRYLGHVLLWIGLYKETWKLFFQRTNRIWLAGVPVSWLCRPFPSLLTQHGPGGWGGRAGILGQSLNAASLHLPEVPELFIAILQ